MCKPICTAANVALPEPGAHITSPVSGTIVRWHILDASGSVFRLRVLRPAGGGTYLGAGASSSETPAGTGLQTFSASLPIQAGDTIGLDNESTSAEIGSAPASGAEAAVFAPPLAEGASSAPSVTVPTEVAFNAEVQPPPGVTSVSPASGSLLGGTSVVITGHDFTGATAVAFGNTPAASFTVNSDTQITATSPPASALGVIFIIVTTPVGQNSVESTNGFTYKGCFVPPLKRRSLRLDRETLKKAGCALGKVRGRKSKSAKVVKQNPKPGKVLPPGTKVNVKLGG